MYLLGKHFAEGTAKHGEVLGEHKDLAAIDRSPPGDNTVGVGAFLDTRIERTVAGKHVEFME